MFRTYCFVGVQGGVGTTTIAVSAANYLTSVEKQKVLYIELKEKSDLFEVVKGKRIFVESTIGYSFKKVTYILSTTPKEAILLIKSFDGIVIVDMSHITEENRLVFEMVDKRVVIGSVIPWKIKNYERFIKNYIEKKDDMYSGLFAYLKNKDQIICADERIKSLPIINDPFRLKEKEFDLISDVLA